MLENYKKINAGHWFQSTLTGNIQRYDIGYVKSRYDVYDTVDKMSELRYNLIANIVGDFHSICDFGYGNGSFMKYCLIKNKLVYGYDISDYGSPQGAIRIKNPDDVDVDVYTFFDSLEHLNESNLTSFLVSKPTKFICISVPWFHESQGTDWFLNWKHRRENEHLHHFDSFGLMNLIIGCGYKVLYVGNPEDAIRKSQTNLPNILTVIAEKI